MRKTALAILTLAGSALLVAAPALSADETGQRPTPAFETPGTQPAPAMPDPVTTPSDVPDPMRQTDPTLRRDQPGMQPSSPARPAPSAAATGQEYVVEAGDTLGEIAKRELGSASKWREIARANGIEKPETLRVGQKLQIPRTDGSSAPAGGSSRL